MKQYVVKSEGGKLYGPFKNAASAAKWANKHLLGSWGSRQNWSMLLLFAR